MSLLVSLLILYNLPQTILIKIYFILIHKMKPLISHIPKKPKVHHEPQDLSNDIDSDISDEDVRKIKLNYVKSLVQVLLKVGKIPLKWYDNFKHLGYDKTSAKIVKKQQGILYIYQASNQ